MHPIKKTENSTQKTAGRKSKQTVLDQTRQDHRKSGDRLIATKPLSTVLVMYSNVDNSLLSKLDELRVLIHTNKYYIITLTEIKPKHGTLPDPGLAKFDWKVVAQQSGCPTMTGGCPTWQGMKW